MTTLISKRELDRAGDALRFWRNDKEYWNAIDLLNYWREQHVLPMDFYFDACRDLAKSPQYKGTLIAERLKRLPTIIDKLNRFPHMHLSSMQDVGGVRVILENIESLLSFDTEICQLPTLKSSKDYLAAPKASGYRGKHLIFERNGMLVEMQLRTQLQHLWATSVETIDVIRGTSMKTRRSDTYWQQFFELAASAFAYMESLPMLPQHQGWDIIQLRDAIRNILQTYPIENSLKSYAATYNVIDGHEQGDDTYYAVMTFDQNANNTQIAYYPENRYLEAVRDYEAQEAGANDNVLVSVNDLQKLHDAYPNYFKSITEFAEKVLSILDF